MLQNHPELIYLDNGATTYKPNSVIQAILSYYNDFTSNVERGDYETAVKADYAFEAVRQKMADLIHAQSSQEIVFTANVTSSLNQIVYGLRKQLKTKDVVYITEGEHASNVLPWFRLQEELGIEVEYLPVDEVGRVLLDKVSLKENTKVISIAEVTNVLGTIQPIRELSQLAHEAGAIMVVDAAQTIAHHKVDVQDLNVDYLCFSSHKMYGPNGVGILYGKKPLLDALEPIGLGGGMNARFYREGRVELKEAPHKFEAGTPNIEGVIGLGAACDFLLNIGLDEIEAYEKDIRAYFYEQVKDFDFLEIYNRENAFGPITFNVKGIFSQDVAGYLAHHHIAVRSGNHCAKLLHHIIGTDQSVRASLAIYNNREDIDQFVKIIHEISLEKAIDIFF
ncbi:MULTISPECIES: aminotransferase class V-fold PLP-dependent enzyme [Terrabacteria group]|nr:MULTISPECIES: cysteine desulfurase [Terrabacteria group]MBW9212360.1 cysteine desulfurase [Trueperella sp. zg.1013]